MPHNNAQIEKLLASTLQATGAGFAAIMGNIEIATDGTFNHLHKGTIGRPGYGLFGMSDDMAQDFQTWLEENKSHNSAKSQIEYLRVVIEEGRFIGEKQAQKLRDGLNSGSTDHATQVFQQIVGGSGKKFGLDARQDAAEAYTSG